MASARNLVFILCLLSLCVASFCATKKEPAFIEAACDLGDFGNATGQVHFLQSRKGGPTYISGYIVNVTPGLHGWHIHELPLNETAEDVCISAGGHFNPDKVNHSAPHGCPRHVGDLGNFVADPLGVGVVGVTDFLVSLVEDKDECVIGRTLVIHQGMDDLGLGGDEGSLANGNAGARVGCCTIYKLVD